MRRHSTRYWIIKYAILTAAIFVPLLWSFRYVRNLYPFTAWNVMMGAGDLETGRNYFMLRGETISGETIDIPAISLTNAMYSRTWTMVGSTAFNRSFLISPLYPENAALLDQVGGIDKLPLGARMPELLAAWGNIYNSRLPESSPDRLKAIRIDMYRWTSGRYADYQTFVESWRKEL